MLNMDTNGGPRIQNDVIVSHTVSTRVGFIDVPSSYRQPCSGLEASNPCAMVMTPISALCSAGRPLHLPQSDRLSMASPGFSGRGMVAMPYTASHLKHDMTTIACACPGVPGER